MDEYLEGFNDLFSKGRKIIFNIKFIYKKIIYDSTTAKGKKKKKSTIKVQKLQRTADADLWTRIYKYYRCKNKYCK